jgi:hypothetical protein
MKEPLKEFRDSYLELLLSFVWKQWSSLGVAGYSCNDDNWYIDPEALLIFSLHIGRYEARLFDEILNWLSTNGHLINIQRLKTILKKEKFLGSRIIPVVAEILTEKTKGKKWEYFVKSFPVQNTCENLFLQKNGQPIEMFGEPDPIFQKYGFSRGKTQFRRHTQPVRLIKSTGLLFKLRGLFGINARSEIFLYLLVNESGHPSLIAREIYYAQKTVQDILVEMTNSNITYIMPVGREKHYQLKKDEWLNILTYGNKNICWVNWPRFFSALESIWIKLDEKKFHTLDSLTQSSELRILMKSVKKQIESSGFGGPLSNESLYLGTEYIEVFISDIKNLLRKNGKAH